MWMIWIIVHTDLWEWFGSLYTLIYVNDLNYCTHWFMRMIWIIVHTDLCEWFKLLYISAMGLASLRHEFEHACCLLCFSKWLFALNTCVVYSTCPGGCLLWTCVLFTPLVQVAVCFEHACCLLHLSRWLFALTGMLFTPLVQVAVCFEQACCLLHLSRWLFALNRHVVYSTYPSGCLLWTHVLFIPLLWVSKWLFTLNTRVVYSMNMHGVYSTSPSGCLVGTRV